MSLPPENPATTAVGASAVKPEFSREDRILLLRLAHQAIETAVNQRELTLFPMPAHLAQARGAFTTLYLDGELRGCVGYVLPVVPLYRTVAESARAAALDDVRFSPVTPAEAPRLELVLNILSPLRPITPELVEIGRHGLVVTLGMRRGLLLPQVPVEHGWDRETYLCQTCRKAGLPSDAWQQGAVLESFTTEIFGDRDLV